MDLFTYYRSTASYRVRIALALKGLEYSAIPVNLMRDGGEQPSPQYRAINPQGRVPALRVDGGLIISQSGAIIEYLEERFPEPPLLAVDLETRARQRAVAALIACDIHPLHNVSVLHRLRVMGHDQADVGNWIRHWIEQGLGAVEHMIADEGYCFGEASPGLADLYLLPQVYAAQRFEVALTPYPRIQRVAQRAMNHWAFQVAHPDAQADKPE